MIFYGPDEEKFYKPVCPRWFVLVMPPALLPGRVLSLVLLMLYRTLYPRFAILFFALVDSFFCELFLRIVRHESRISFIHLFIYDFTFEQMPIDAGAIGKCIRTIGAWIAHTVHRVFRFYVECQGLFRWKLCIAWI